MPKKRPLILCVSVLLAAVMLLSGCGIVYDPNATLPHKMPHDVTEPPVSTTSGEYAPPASPYGVGDFTFENGYLKCRDGKAVMGIDVSAHQKEIDWESVKNTDVEFAIIRVGYRGYGGNGSTHIDEYAKANLEGARAAGIPIGCYFFSQAINVEEAREEANIVLSVLDGMPLELPVVFDWEYVSATARTARTSARTVTDCTLEFCRIIAEAGYTPMIYFNADHANDRLYLEEVEQYAWWFARYSPELGPMYKTDVWQYTDSGTIAGITKPVDINMMFTEWGIGKQLFGSK